MAIPYPKNAPGDFYVGSGECMSCGVPRQEAPELISHSKQEYGHCYFHRQPHSDEEVQQAIKAIAASCCEAIYYCGDDPAILKRLQKLGMENCCLPIGTDTSYEGKLARRQEAMGFLGKLWAKLLRTN